MADPSADKRLAFIGNYTLSTLKLKQDKWLKCLGVEEHLTVIKEFADKGENVLLIISIGAGGLLVPGLEFSPSGKTKAVYFIKRAPSSLSNDNIKAQMIFGDLSYSPLEQMSSLVDDVSMTSITHTSLLFILIWL